MPKRSDRDVFGEQVFQENPFEDFSPEEIYKKLQWGNEPNEFIPIDAPEPLVALGYLAKIKYAPSGVRKFNENRLHLAVGAETNFLYIFPRKVKFIPGLTDVDWQQGSSVKRTEYYSN